MIEEYILKSGVFNVALASIVVIGIVMSLFISFVRSEDSPEENRKEAFLSIVKLELIASFVAIIILSAAMFAILILSSVDAQTHYFSVPDGAREVLIDFDGEYDPNNRVVIGKDDSTSKSGYNEVYLMQEALSKDGSPIVINLWRKPIGLPMG